MLNPVPPKSFVFLPSLICCIDEDASKIPDVSIVESSAEMLYGLVHQRYILTRAGLQAMVCAFVFIYVATALISKLG